MKFTVRLSVAKMTISHFDSSKLVFESPIYEDITLKFLVIGDYGVGKTALVRRYVEGKFSSNYKLTIGAEFSIKSCLWNTTTKINIQLWDIAGHERFGSMTRVYYKHASAAIVVFDVTRLQTFQSIEKWVNDVRDKVLLADGTKIPIIILANKSDVEGCTIPIDEMDTLCSNDDILGWLTTSAKNNTNIDEAMDRLIRFSLENRQIVRESKECVSLTDTLEENKQSKGCCS